MAFPFYKQLDTMDCGPTCLRIIAKYYGKDFAIDFLREKCYISRDGVSLLGISEAAENIGFQADPVQITWNQLVNDVNLPCVVHWNQEHFLVVYKIKKYFFSKKYLIYVSDPAHGKIKYNEDKFMHSWATIIDEDGEKAGLALLMETTPHFNQVEAVQSKTNISFLFNYFKTYRKLIFLIIISVLFASLISAIFPFLMQSIVDTGIGNKDINFILIVLMAQLMLTLGQATNNFIRNRLILYVTTRVSISIISDFLRKLMRLPIAFFEKRLMGDITQRIEDYNKIQIFMSETLLSLITSVVIFLVYGIVMIKYNMMILSIFIFFSLLYVIWILLFLGKRRKLEYMRIQESSMNHSHIYHLIDEMSEIKLNNNEEKRRKDWEKTQASLFSISIKSLNMGQKQEAGALIINQTKNLLITFLSAQLVINGQISFGMMMAIQYIMGQLNAPLTQFINFVKSFQDAKISIERINEIQNREDEEYCDNSKIKEIPNNQDIVLKNVVFQYEGPHSEKVLNNITLTIPAGKTTAIVGSSGSGKTTLLKLILKFYNPVRGIILCDNIPLYQYSESSWRKECGVVMQEGKIFSDTILSNVIVADENYSLDLVKQALITANIWDFVESLPLNINTKIGHNGHGLSIGQMQRVLIARAVYKNPKIVLLDEATNSLDANNEKKILNNLKHFLKNRTSIIVAHRLSTVQDADQIVVIEKGQIVEIGTHIELSKKRGHYYRLVKNQLEL